MTRRLTWVVWAILFLMFFPIGAAETAFSYPDVAETITFIHTTEREFAFDELADFLQQWHLGTRGFEQTLMEKIATQNQLLGTLKSISRVQTAQLEHIRRQTRSIFSITNDPASPLYAFRLMTTPVPASPPVDSLSHQFGLNFGLAQKLPTSGMVNLALKHGISMTSEDSGPWKWKQSPSIGLTLQQPLGLGEGVLDGQYGKKVEEKQMLERASALEAVQQTKYQVYLQAITLQSRRQALVENRWLSGQQALLADKALLDAQLNLEAGRISRNQLERQQAAFEQQLLQIAELDREIEKINASLETTLGELSTDLPLIDLQAIGQLTTYTNDEVLLKRALQADSDYKEAERDLQVALLDKSLGNPADAPTFSVSVQFSPYYTPTAGNGLWGSFDELFTTSDPTLSVSVGFMANDLSRSTSKLTKQLGDEQIVQASLRKDQAVQAVTQKGSDYVLLINKEFATLAALLDDYKYALNELEVVRIRSAAGLADQTSFRQKEIGIYNAAFAVLQKLRNMTLLAVELEVFTGSLRL